MKSNLLTALKQQAGAMTPTHRRITDYILKNPVDASFLTLDQLSRIVGTSTTSVMRLSLKLGYTGYSEFQRDLQAVLRDRVAPTTRLEINKKKLERSSILEQCAGAQLDNLKSAVEFLTDDIVDKALKLIRNAGRVYVIGMRSSYAVAHYLQYALNQILGNCILLKADSGDNVDTLLDIKSDDVVIAVTLPRYAKGTVELLKIVRGFGPGVIAITDGYNSPMAPLADVVLPCPFRSLSFHNSLVGPIFLADFLITAVALSQPEKTRARLEAAEVILKKLNIHTDE